MLLFVTQYFLTYEQLKGTQFSEKNYSKEISKYIFDANVSGKKIENTMLKQITRRTAALKKQLRPNLRRNKL